VIRRAVKLATPAVWIALVVTAVRFSLELAGVPEVYIFPIGLLWLTLAFAVYWGVKLSDETRPYRLLILSLVVFSPPSRFPVFVVWWVTKTWELGTHYDIFESWEQALVGQLFYGSLVQIIPGTLLGSLTLFIRRRRARPDGAP